MSAPEFASIENGYVQAVDPALPALTPEAASHIRFVRRQEEGGLSDDIFVERFFPAPHHHENLWTPQDAEARAEEYAAHVGRLAIRTPTIYERRIEPAEKGYRIRSIAEYVPHRPLVVLDGSGKTRVAAEDVPIVVDVLTKVMNYLGPIPRMPGQRYLSDITRIAQYGVTQDGAPLLPDTDEFMVPATDHRMSQDGVNLLRAISLLLPQGERTTAIGALFQSGIPFS